MKIVDTYCNENVLFFMEMCSQKKNHKKNVQNKSRKQIHPIKNVRELTATRNNHCQHEHITLVDMH